MKRTIDGLHKLLTLHTAVELSSICGCLQLKVQQKGENSREQILKYATYNGEIDNSKVMKILGFMWEGALFEYLRMIGHPIYTIRTDPKTVVMRLWESGGFFDQGDSFVPHFIVREVKNRYEWVQSEDIRSRMDKLRLVQEGAKVAEKKVFAEHDYTNILKYFQQMSELRAMENTMREYLISELEVCRSRLHSSEEVASIHREQMADLEMQFVGVAEQLNTQLASYEFTCSALAKEKFRLEGDLQRLINIVDSYSNSAVDRATAGGGGVRALQLKDIHECTESIIVLHEKMQLYRNMRDDVDSSLRAKCRSQEEEIKRLTELCAEQQEQVDFANSKMNGLEGRAVKAETELESTARRLIKLKERTEVSSNEGWGSSTRFAAKLYTRNLQLQKLRPILMLALRTNNPVMFKIAKAILLTLEMAEEVEINEIAEGLLMAAEDSYSKAAAKAEQRGRKREMTIKTSGAVTATTAKEKGKGGKSAKGRGKSRRSNSSSTGRSKGSDTSGRSSKKQAKSSPNKSIKNNRKDNKKK